MKLEGIKVVDLSWFLPGPYLTTALADHGAEVIKVEPPGEGDPGRHIRPPDQRTSVFFRNMARGKKSVVLDLKSERGRADLFRLCREADVIVNARVAIDPAVLQDYVRQTLHTVCQERGATLYEHKTQSFRPGRPMPTHRYAVAK